MSELLHSHELEEPPYDYERLRRFENLARKRLTHIDKIKYDADAEKIVLLPSIEITDSREEILANQISEVADELSFNAKIVSVEPDEVRLDMSSYFKY